MRLLFLSPRPPLPPDRGDQRRVLHLVEELAARTELALLTFGEPGSPAPPGVRTVTVVPSVKGRAAANLRRRDPFLPGQVRLFLDAGMQAAVDRELAEHPPDVVHVTLSRMAPYLPAAGTAHRHLDFVDALSLNMRTRAQTSRGPARAALGAESRLMLRYEAACAAAADSCSVVSEDDRLVPGLDRSLVVPNGVDLERFAFVAPAERAPELMFFGNLGYYHNVAPAVHVASEVLPRVRARRPDAVLRVVGARPAAAVRRLADLDGVEVVGPVDDMAAELRRAAVAVLPMFSGSGIKNKVLEAFACGTPVVANALGIQGVEGAHAGTHHLQGEGADALAEHCLTLLAGADRRVALATAGRELVATRYTWAAQAERLLAAYATTAR